MLVLSKLRSTFLSLTLILAMGALPFAGCGDDEEQRTICPVSDTCPASGTQRYTYKELSQKWWQWALAIPASKNPILDADGSLCAEQQPAGPVWFLAGTGGDPAKRSCKVPADRGLFFPVLAMFCTACKKDEDCQARGYPTDECPEDPQDDQSLLDCLKGEYPDNVVELGVTIDGKAVDDVFGYRTDGGIFTITAPTDPNELLFACTAGQRKAYADGYYVFVEPLSAGAHKVVIKAKDKSGYEVNVEYSLDVQAK